MAPPKKKTYNRRTSKGKRKTYKKRTRRAIKLDIDYDEWKLDLQGKI
jgi:hypothetical protein